MKRLPDWRLYLVTDRPLARGRSIAWVVETAVRGGVTAVQLREKSCSASDYVQLGRELKSLLAPRQMGKAPPFPESDCFGRACFSLPRVPLIINDRVDLALEIGADGVHIGQHDMDPGRARKLLGPDAIIGLSIETIEQARAAASLDVDYLGVGPVFATATKSDAAPPLGLAALAQIRAVSRHRVVAIGGIGMENARQAIDSGADGVAVVSAICAADDPERAARDLRQSIDAALLARVHPV